MSQLVYKEIYKKYADFVALDGVSFSISKGEFVFLVGPSGAGKSTLVKLLLLEEAPDSGEILFENRNVLETTKAELPEHRRKIGTVFQDFKVLDSKTVFENVAVALEVINTPREEIDEVVPNVLNLVGLQQKINMYPKQLSGGEKQRLAIARALAHEPTILVADEPTGMIDPISAKGVMQILQKINSLGTTVLMATHDQGIVNSMKKRVIKIDKGKIVSDKKEGTYD